MANIELSVGHLSWSMDISMKDVIDFFVRREKDVYLDYQTSTIQVSYANNNINWLQIVKGRERLRSPYSIVFDYRNRSKELSWGSFEFIEDYEFPSHLAKHKQLMVEKFKKENRLTKGDNPAPRVSKFDMIKGKPFFSLQKAFYTDQIGTNLTLDFPISKPINVKNKICTTVREWDIAQAGHEKKLPEFHQSKLANTIGVAIGVTAQLQNGRNVILRRKRARNISVYAEMWHVPFSFALTMSQFKDDKKGEIESLIRTDWGHEFSNELGLEFADFNPPQILAFCRDLVRGGKPQFFFEMKARLTFEELRKKLTKKSSEFIGNIEELKETKSAYSPELEAFTLLKSVSEK